MSSLALLGGPPAVTAAPPRWPVIDEDVEREVLRVLRSEPDLGGASRTGAIQEMEMYFAGWQNRKYCIGVSSGTAALTVGVALANLEPGDEVLVSPYTWGATVACILHNNAVPVFVDIDPNSLTIDPSRIEEKITERTRAIVVVHIYGYPARMDEIMSIARKHNLLVVEDCAQAHGAMYKHVKVGSWGDVGAFSFQNSKTIPAGEGGAMVLDDYSLYQRALARFVHPSSAGITDPELLRYRDSLGYNFRMHQLEAAMVLVGLRAFRKRHERKTQVINRLRKAFSALPGIAVQQVEPDVVPSYHILPLFYRREQLDGLPRDVFVKALRAEGVPIGQYVQVPIHLRPTHQDKSLFGKGYPWKWASRPIEYAKGDCPVAERHCEEFELTLPASALAVATDEWVRQIETAFIKVVENADELKGQTSTA